MDIAYQHTACLGSIKLLFIFDVLTAVEMLAFWVVAPHGHVLFREIYCIHLQDDLKIKIYKTVSSRVVLYWSET
jgi:hypothetical protein